MAVGKRSSERALQKVLGQGANVNEANPLEVHDPKVGSLISYEGVTTADGAGDGSTLIDSVLTTKPDYNGNLVIITSGAYAGQGRDINGATTGGTVTPASAFGGQILSGTSFVILALGAGVSYFEQTVPIKMNCTQTITATKGDKVFIAAGATGASGLISTNDANVQKVFLLIIGRAVNIYAGTNALDCSTADGTPADNNQWQIDLDSGGFGDLTNEEADGQMLDNDWRCPVVGAIHPFTLMFDVDTELTNIDGKIGVQLKDARSEQDSLITTIDVYLKVLWKL